MRGWLNEGKSYIPPVQIGDVMRAGTVGKVIESNNERFKVGDYVSGWGGVQEYTISEGKDYQIIHDNKINKQSYLGVLGMPGFTAYFGILKEFYGKKYGAYLLSLAITKCFEKKINNFLDQKSSNELEYSAEPKIDGISASLIYKSCNNSKC